jgi:hypothetical protein
VAKRPEELENPVVSLAENRKWLKSPNTNKRDYVMCACGCNKEVFLDESYIIVDERYFWDAEHVTDYFISQAGGRRVWGGFDDAS